MQSTQSAPSQHVNIKHAHYTLHYACKPWPCQRTTRHRFLKQSRGRHGRTAVLVSADANKKPLVVVGSINADMMLQVDRFPKPGETLTAKSMNTSAGGKVHLVLSIITDLEVLMRH